MVRTTTTRTGELIACPTSESQAKQGVHTVVVPNRYRIVYCCPSRPPKDRRVLRVRSTKWNSGYAQDHTASASATKPRSTPKCWTHGSTSPSKPSSPSTWPYAQPKQTHRSSSDQD